MPTTYHFCPVCFNPVRHPQQVTCGGPDCRETWKHMPSALRLTRSNLASLSPSERELALQQPDTAELERREVAREQLATDIATQKEATARKSNQDFFNDLMANYTPPKGGD